MQRNLARSDSGSKKNDCFEITGLPHWPGAGFSKKKWLFLDFYCVWHLVDNNHLSRLEAERAAHTQYVADLFHQCLRCFLLSAQVKPQRCPHIAPVQWLGVSWFADDLSVYPQKQDKQPVTSLKPQPGGTECVSLLICLFMLSWLQQGQCAVSCTVQTITYCHGLDPSVIHFH